MKLQYVPLLRVQRELQGLPRNYARFRKYLATMLNEDGLELPPLGIANPMARDHVTVLLDALLAMDADGIGAPSNATRTRRPASSCPGGSSTSGSRASSGAASPPRNARRGRRSSSPHIASRTFTGTGLPGHSARFTPRGLSPWAGLALALCDGRARLPREPAAPA